MIRVLGQFFVEAVERIGELALLARQVLASLLAGDVRRRSVVQQMSEVGYGSLPMITIAALFTGMVMVVQMARQFQTVRAENLIGAVVGLSLARELAPVLAATVVAGRVGSAFAAEISTMRVTEQIDALEVLAVSPAAYLALPRVLACLVMCPLLTVYSFIVGLAGGLLVAVHQVGISQSTFTQSIKAFVHPQDLGGALVKGAIFGGLIALVACQSGFSARGGAMGVGQATTEAVVVVVTLLLVSNYFLSCLLFPVNAALAGG